LRATFTKIRDRVYKPGFYLFETAVIGGTLLIGALLLSTNHMTLQGLASLWYMPILGIIAATIGMTTPAGGGVVFFPTLVLSGVPPVEAAAFSLGAQSFGMGLFGTWNWFKKDHTAIIVPVVVITVLSAWFGSLLGMFLFPIESAAPLRLIFSTFGAALAIYIIIMLVRGINKEVREFELNAASIFACVSVGLAGGLLVSYIGVGVDAIIFFVLTYFFKVFSRRATVTSIVTMGFSAMLPFAFQLFYFHNVPLEMLYMVLPGILVGARVGPWLNFILGPPRVLGAFACLLILEFLMTIYKLVLFG